MSGHSKWSTIKHKKAVTDAKKAGIFTKLSRLVSIAARDGGGDPDMNFKLKMAIDKAKAANVPNNNIERAIKKGIGELKDRSETKEIIYEAYGPGNVAMLIKTTTDNKNRTAGEIKSILTKIGGKLVSEGSVKFLFKKVGNINIPVLAKNLNSLELEVIDIGVEDIIYSEGMLTVYTKPDELQRTKEKIKEKGLKIYGSRFVYVPAQKIKISQGDKDNYNGLIKSLDEQDNIQEIYDNL